MVLVAVDRPLYEIWTRKSASTHETSWSRASISYILHPVKQTSARYRTGLCRDIYNYEIHLRWQIWYNSSSAYLKSRDSTTTGCESNSKWTISKVGYPSASLSDLRRQSEVYMNYCADLGFWQNLRMLQAYRLQPVWIQTHWSDVLWLSSWWLCYYY